MQQQEVTYVFKDLKLFPSANVLLKMHFTERSKIRDKAQWLFKEQGIVQFKGPVKIRFIRYAVKLMDWDNFGISGKKFFDGMVRCGIIEDDNPKIVREFQPEQYRVKHFEEQKIIIKIYSLTI
jgi:hypothetical protein